MSNRPLVLMDTTLRDGEQTPNVSFSPAEKLRIASTLLCDVGVNRIEVGSARVSAGEARAARLIADWASAAGWLHAVEMLGFCDGDRSVDWIAGTGVKRVNLLVKGSEQHCRLQLGEDLDQHLRRVADTLQAARSAGLEVSGVYLEDWSRGVAENSEYVFSLVRGLVALGVRRVYLADTLGVLEPRGAYRYVRLMRRSFPDLLFEFHAHDDYGLATANCLAAARAGVDGLHTTVNGMGERAGNACLAEVTVVVRDHAGRATGVNEARLPELSGLVAQASGCGIVHNAPVVGEHVFTQTAGIHADGDRKASLYCTELAPERFGRRRQYALGKLSGRASLAYNLRELGLELDPRVFELLLERVRALGDDKRRVEASELAGLAGLGPTA